MTPSQLEEIQSKDEEDRCMTVLKIWSNQRKGENELTEALKLIGREDVIASLQQSVIKKKITFSLKASNPDHDYLDKSETFNFNYFKIIKKFITQSKTKLNPIYKKLI